MSSRRWCYSTSFSFLLPELSKVGSMCIKTGGEGNKGWLQSWGWYVLSTWWFGCAHRPVGGSSSGGVSQRSVGGPFAGILGQTAGYTFLQFSSPSFLSSPPPTPSHCDFFSERETGPSSCSMHGQVDAYLSPSPSTPLPECLYQSAATPATVASPATHLGPQPPLRSNPPTFGYIHEWII